MRIIARFTKSDAVRFVSHLDIQRLIHRAFRRAGLPIAFSKGFNPHPLTSFASALSVGVTSDAEWFDVHIAENIEPCEFAAKLNAVLPEGFRIEQAFKASDDKYSLTAFMEAGEYRIDVSADEADITRIQGCVSTLLDGPIIVQKKTKSGIKDVDISPGGLKCNVEVIDDTHAVLNVTTSLTVSGSVNPDLFLGALSKAWCKNADYSIHRTCIYSKDGLYMPLYQQ